MKEVEQLRNPGPSLTLREVVGRGSLRFGAAVLLFATTLLSPVDAPVRPVNAESNPQQVNSLTLLHGNDSERRARLNIMLLRDQGVTDQMLQGVAADIFLIHPTNEFTERVNVYTKNPEEDLRCDQNARCDWDGAVKREIDRAVTKGVIPHETLVIIKSNDGGGTGQAFFASSFGPPYIYTSSAVVRPENVPPRTKELDAAVVAHELWGHAFAGFDHEGGDLMVGSGNKFNPQHTQYLRDLMELTPYNYLTPANEIRLQLRGSLSVVPPQEDGISAVIYSPTGTRQLLSEIRPLNGNGQVMLEYVDKPERIHAWSEIGKKIPFKTLSPGTEYLWQVCSSGLLTPLSPEDPRWTQVEAWPGKFFSNPCVEATFTTPDGVYRVYLPVVGKSANP